MLQPGFVRWAASHDHFRPNHWQDQDQDYSVQDRDRYFWSQTSLVLRPTASGHITGCNVFTARRFFVHSKWLRAVAQRAVTLVDVITCNYYILSGGNEFCSSNRCSRSSTEFECKSKRTMHWLTMASAVFQNPPGPRAGDSKRIPRARHFRASRFTRSWRPCFSFPRKRAPARPWRRDRRGVDLKHMRHTSAKNKT